MNYLIRIFCQATHSVTRREIEEFIVGGLHFERMPIFIPAFDYPDTMLEDWDQLIILYEQDMPTVNLTRVVDATTLMTEGDAVKDLIATLNAPIDVQQQLIETIDATAQLIVIDIDRESLSEEAWSMLDSLENYLAGNLMGLVYAPDDGFYGSGLELLHKIG